MAVGRVTGGTTPSAPSPARRRTAAPGARGPAGRARTGPAKGSKGAKGRAAGRGPFAVLVVLMLAGGLIALLSLNTALNQGSFQLSQLQQRTNTLTDERQGLQQQIGAWSDPDALAARARQLGMVPGGNPAFLEDNGTVLGRPVRLDGSLALPTATPTPSATATATATATGSTTATASTTTTTAATGTAVPTTTGTPGATTATPGATAGTAAHAHVAGAAAATATARTTAKAPAAATPPHRATTTAPTAPRSGD